MTWLKLLGSRGRERTRTRKMSSLAGALYSALHGVCAEERMNLFKFEDSN